VSAREALVAAIVARLEATFSGAAVFDAPPMRMAHPYAVVEEPVLADWSSKSWRGHEARIAVTIRDEGERPVRLRALLAQAEEAVAGLPRTLDGGWRTASVTPLRSRLVRSGGRGWLGQAEFTVRLWRDGV
jgi:hypothetical protein